MFFLNKNCSKFVASTINAFVPPYRLETKKKNQIVQKEVINKNTLVNFLKMNRSIEDLLTTWKNPCLILKSYFNTLSTELILLRFSFRRRVAACWRSGDRLAGYSITEYKQKITRFCFIFCLSYKNAATNTEVYKV